MLNGHKKCPHCQEEVKRLAKKCKHCKSEIELTQEEAISLAVSFIPNE